MALSLRLAGTALFTVVAAFASDISTGDETAIVLPTREELRELLVPVLRRLEPDRGPGYGGADTSLIFTDACGKALHRAALRAQKRPSEAEFFPTNSVPKFFEGNRYREGLITFGEDLAWLLGDYFKEEGRMCLKAGLVSVRTRTGSSFRQGHMWHRHPTVYFRVNLTFTGTGMLIDELGVQSFVPRGHTFIWNGGKRIGALAPKGVGVLEDLLHDHPGIDEDRFRVIYDIAPCSEGSLFR
jgi:hypothetical protein